MGRARAWMPGCVGVAKPVSSTRLDPVRNAESDAP